MKMSLSCSKLVPFSMPSAAARAASSRVASSTVLRARAAREGVAGSYTICPATEITRDAAAGAHVSEIVRALVE